MTKSINFKNTLLSSIIAVAACLPMASHAEQATVKAFTYAMDDARIAWSECPAFFGKGCMLGVLQGDPSKPNSDVIFKTPGNYDLPAHWHTSAERMVLISGEMDLTYQGQPTIKIKQGMYIYGPPKVPHTGRCVSAEPCELFISFEGPVDAHEGHGH